MSHERNVLGWLPLPWQVAAAQKLESDLRLQQAKHEAALAELKLRHDAVRRLSVHCFQGFLFCGVAVSLLRGSVAALQAPH